MRLDPGQSAIIILMVALGVQLTRWLPFLLFPEKKELPQVVLYLGKVLPAAMMGLLVVYCLKHVTWLSSPPRRAGGAGHPDGGAAPPVERECAPLHRRGYGPLYAAGASGLRVKSGPDSLGAL